MSKKAAREELAALSRAEHLMNLACDKRVDIEITRTDRKPRKSFGSLSWTQLKQKPTKQET